MTKVGVLLGGWGWGQSLAAARSEEVDVAEFGHFRSCTKYIQYYDNIRLGKEHGKLQGWLTACCVLNQRRL